MSKLDAKRVRDILVNCLFKEDPEPGTQYIPVIGITVNLGFRVDRINEYSGEIKELLNELPDGFKESSGGGWSFLQAYVDKDDNQWGDHKNMEELMMLGVASGWAGYLLPKDLWCALPGSVPYFAVFDSRHEVETYTVEE